MADLAEQVGAHSWYHTIELPGGVTTPGWYDTVGVLPKVPLPESLEGKRCLDVGLADGFWAFEMERRGASEVVGLDIAGPHQLDWSLRVDSDRLSRGFGVVAERFEIAAGALGSSVQRHVCSIYDADPAELGQFDLVHIGALLLHLRDPIGALMNLRRLTRGELLSVDYVSIPASVTGSLIPLVRQARTEFPQWWLPGLAAYRNYFLDAGFELAETGRPFRYPFGPGFPRPNVRDLRQLRFGLLQRPFGATFSWALARPSEPRPA